MSAPHDTYNLSQQCTSWLYNRHEILSLMIGKAPTKETLLPKFQRLIDKMVAYGQQGEKLFQQCATHTRPESLIQMYALWQNLKETLHHDTHSTPAEDLMGLYADATEAFAEQLEEEDLWISTYQL